MIFRLALALMCLFVADAARFKGFGKRDDGFGINTGRQGRSLAKRDVEKFTCVNKIRPCPEEGSKCCTDNYFCQNTSINGSLRCLPVSKGVTNCGAPSMFYPCDSNGYDRNTPPAMALTGGQTVVKIELYLRNIVQYRDTGLYNLDFYVNLYWKDPRLAHNVKPMLLYHTKDQLNSVWRPDLYFSTAVQTYRQEMLTPSLSLRVYQDGWVISSERVQVVTACKPNSCDISIESYDHIKNLLDVFWNDDSQPVVVDDSLTDQVIGTEIFYCPEAYFNGQYACLIASFKLASPYDYDYDFGVSEEKGQSAETGSSGEAQGQAQGQFKPSIQPQTSQQTLLAQSSAQLQTSDQLQSPQTQPPAAPQTPQTQAPAEPQSPPQAQLPAEPQTPQTQAPAEPQSPPQAQLPAEPQTPQPQAPAEPQTPQPQAPAEPQTPQPQAPAEPQASSPSPAPSDPPPAPESLPPDAQDQDT